MDKEQEQFIKDNWMSMSVEALRKLFNEKYGTEYKTTAFHYHTNRMGLKKHTEHQYTLEEDEFLRNNSPLLSREQLTMEFNKHFGTNIKQSTINVRCCLKGWSASNDGRYKKGSVPWGKCTGGKEEWYEKYRAVEHTGFKKGHIPHNAKIIGAERIDSRTGRRVIKTEKGWKSVQTIAWETEQGKIPKGFRTMSVTGDINDTNIENLRLIDNSIQTVLMANRWHNKGAEIFDSGVAYAILYCLLKEKMGLNCWDFRNRYVLDR
jgi:hypothetical protein